MNEIKHSLIFLLVGLVLGGIIGYFFGRNSVSVGKPSVKIERDTVTLHDTIPDYMPAAKDSGLVRWMVLRVPVEKATPAEHVADVGNMIVRDTIEVEVPVTQKHYETENYQAWVSGYRPNLDSIEVYQREKIITETVTVTQKAKSKHWGIGFTGGYGYDFNTKTGAPFVGVGLSYNIFSF